MLLQKNFYRFLKKPVLTWRFETKTSIYNLRQLVDAICNGNGNWIENAMPYYKHSNIHKMAKWQTDNCFQNGDLYRKKIRGLILANWKKKKVLLGIWFLAGKCKMCGWESKFQYMGIPLTGVAILRWLFSQFIFFHNLTPFFLIYWIMV